MGEQAGRVAERAVENPARTAAYRALVEERRRAIRTELERVIPHGADLTWEPGCGHGHFLTAYAQTHPERLCVGIDIIRERIDRANRKRERAGLANLHFFHTEARLFLQELPASSGIREIFALFPDPWPKLRHHKHRLIQESFLDLVSDRCRPKCRLHFRTDHEPYFSSVRATLNAHPRWKIVGVEWPFEFETVFQQRTTARHSLSAELQPLDARIKYQASLIK